MGAWRRNSFDQKSCFKILYIPCLISMYKHLEVPCYRLLFYLSLIDCAILWMLGFLHGTLAIIGAVFCSYPKLIYICGAIISGLWIAESVAQISLSVNRCLAIAARRHEDLFFRGKRVLIWIVFSTICGLLWAFFIQPVLFNGVYFTWLFNPYQGYRLDSSGTYHNVIHTTWDMGVAISIPLIYMVFVAALHVKAKRFGKTQKIVSRKQKMMLLQVFIISMLNFVACSVYGSMMYAVPSPILVHFAQFCWLNIHGFPPVIYLTLNKTIQDDTNLWLNSLSRKLPEFTCLKKIRTTTQTISIARSQSSSYL
ncbi:serpentine type 7TM GPCR chemoreceptor srt domain-containing protein [Ditylenchus destructor]|uniref:Serpentine type 7TM GPCR chemoreceptor srt domain-containing protein n=1 Tax=Ditylenchus destructor TaxID=166010 RepID=A0AAD4QX92_9BILA|nr:serpentine type 7TM GPCR chemoreceptor srt domain-containing protein [Ditylenchus destructor]